ncbi:MAG: hypothetical protein ACLFMT_05025 [Halobacteriales archaeon]
MELLTRNVALAALGFAALNAGKATALGYAPPWPPSPGAVPYYVVLVALSLVYAWVFKYAWLRMDDYFESGDGYVAPEWED